MIRTTDIPDLEGYADFIDGIDFKQLTRGEWRELGKLYMNKLVMIIRKSGLKIKKYSIVFLVNGESIGKTMLQLLSVNFHGQKVIYRKF